MRDTLSLHIIAECAFIPRCMTQGIWSSRASFSFQLSLWEPPSKFTRILCRDNFNCELLCWTFLLHYSRERDYWNTLIIADFWGSFSCQERGSLFDCWKWGVLRWFKFDEPGLRTMLLPRRFIAALSQWNPGFDPWSVRVRFVVDRVPLGHDRFRVLYGCSYVSIIPFSIMHHRRNSFNNKRNRQ